MLRMIIVDDEEIVRESLRTLIDWKAYKIEIAAVCKNVLEVYDAIIDDYPDIILTDIQMPGYSGLKLIEQLQQDQSRIEFIILSGYDDFAYAREAMKYGIRHYLLKPCNNDELIAAIQDVSRACYERQPEKIPAHPSRSFIKHALDYIDTHFTDSNLTLKKLADTELFLSVNYVSKQFQNDTGMKFSAYLNMKRMEKAKLLLSKADEELCIYEIAEMVGCGNNPQYFSQLFKKYTGYTPKQYRNLQLSAHYQASQKAAQQR